MTNEWQINTTASYSNFIRHGPGSLHQHIPKQASPFKVATISFRSETPKHTTMQRCTIMVLCNHANAGSNPPGGLTYGSATWPLDAGSGGGGNGGRGGGAMWLSVAGDLVLGAGAHISADAGPCSSYSGTGGAGGSILIVAQRLEGSGNVSASAYQGSDYCSSGGGGGGRIAIYAQNVSNRVAYQVAPQCADGSGGYDLANGGPGTVYLNATQTMTYAGHRCHGRPTPLDVPGLDAVQTMVEAGTSVGGGRAGNCSVDGMYPDEWECLPFRVRCLPLLASLVHLPPPVHRSPPPASDSRCV